MSQSSPASAFAGLPWPPHITVAAIIEREGRFLLVEEETSDGLRLNNPAGHLDPGETPEQGCARETLEETAYLFTPRALIGIYLYRQSQRERTTYLRLAFNGDLGERQERALDHGIVRTLWLTPGEIEQSQARHRSPLVWRCVQDHLAGMRAPLSLLVSHPSLLQP